MESASLLDLWNFWMVDPFVAFTPLEKLDSRVYFYSGVPKANEPSVFQSSRFSLLTDHVSDYGHHSPVPTDNEEEVTPIASIN
jgi:hypothetical protein